MSRLLSKHRSFAVAEISYIVLGVQRTSPGSIWFVAISPSRWHCQWWIKTVKVPPVRTEIARDDVSFPVGSQSTSVAEDDIALGISQLLVIRFFNKASPIHLDVSRLSSWKANILVSADFTDSNAIKVLSKSRWQTVHFRVHVVRPGDQPTQKSIYLRRAMIMSSDTTSAIP